MYEYSKNFAQFKLLPFQIIFFFFFVLSMGGCFGCTLLCQVEFIVVKLVPEQKEALLLLRGPEIIDSLNADAAKLAQ
jgi:hypothetical protein